MAVLNGRFIIWCFSHCLGSLVSSAKQISDVKQKNQNLKILIVLF